MKKFIEISALSLLICILFFLSCKKDKTSTTHTQEKSTSLIKQEFEKRDFRKSLSNRFNDSLNINWEPDWEHLSKKTNNDSTVFYYIPLVPNLTTKAKNTPKYNVKPVGFEQFIIVKQKSPDEFIFSKAQYIFDSRGYKNMQVTSKRSNQVNYLRFTGKLLLDNLSGKTSAINYVQGQPIKAIGSQNARIVCDNECYWYTWCERGPWVSVTYGRDGESCSAPDWGPDAMDCGGSVGTGGGWQLQSSNTTNCVDIPDVDTPPLPDPSGHNGGGDVPNSVTTIKNDLKNQCLRNALEKILNAGLKNKISAVINKVFNTTADINLTFTEKSEKEINTSGDVFYGYTDIPHSVRNGDPVQYAEIEIQLNKDLLPSRPEELITTVILHESLHAYIGLMDIKSSVVYQHEIMAATMRDKIMEALGEIYPDMSSEDKSALSWGGLVETFQWSQTKLNSYRGNDNNAIKALETLKKYETGKAGTPSKCF